MSKITLKDKHLRIMGYIETKPDGVKVGKDAHLRIVGYFDPRSNVTKDAHLRIIAQGDVLSGLIMAAN